MLLSKYVAYLDQLFLAPSLICSSRYQLVHISAYFSGDANAITVFYRDPNRLFEVRPFTFNLYYMIMA